MIEQKYMQYSEVNGDEKASQFIATLLDIEEDEDDPSERVLTLLVNNEEIKIRRPRTKGWKYKIKGDSFIVTKIIIKGRGTLYTTDVFETHGQERKIPELDIFDMQAPDYSRPNIISLTIMKKVRNEYYIVYFDKKVYKLHNTFKFENPHNIDAGLGTKVFIDITDDKNRIVTLLGTKYYQSKMIYLQRYSQDKYDKQTFNDTPLTKDQHLRFNSTKNIDLIDRGYQGLLLIEPLSEEREHDKANARIFLTARINNETTVVLKKSTKDEWANISGSEILVVRKITYTGDNGNDYSRLFIVDTFSSYDDIRIESFDELTNDSHGVMKELEFQIVYHCNDFIIIHTMFGTNLISTANLKPDIISSLIEKQTTDTLKYCQ